MVENKNIELQSNSVETNPKRGRGRPRIKPKPDETKPKRGRGRPRTKPKQDENDENKIKKVIGRPRIKPKPDETKPKRGRGRPKTTKYIHRYEHRRITHDEYKKLKDIEKQYNDIIKLVYPEKII